MNVAVERAEQGDYKGFWESCEMFPDDWLTVCWKAICLFCGLGCEKDQARGGQIAQKIMPTVMELATTNNAIAQCKLGEIYGIGCGVGKDDARAVMLFGKAAEQGYAKAQYNLGLMYANGRGVEKDEVVSAMWYRKAAEQGHVKAQSNLERMLANGRGVEKDDAKAAPWCRKATEQGRDLSLYCEAGHSLFDNYIANEVSSALREAIKGESFCSVDAVYVNVTYEWFNVIVSLADYTLGGQIIERNADFLIAVVADVVAPKIGVATDELKKKGRLIIGLDGVGAQLVFHVAVLPDPFVMFSKSVEGKRLKDGALLERYAKEGVLSPVRLFLHNQYRECVIDVQRGCFKIEKHLGKFVTLLIKWPRPPEELSVDQLLSTQPNFHSLTLEYDADHVVSRCYIPKIGLSRNIRDFNVPIWHISDKPEVSSTGLAYNPNRFADFVDAVSARRPTKDEIDGYYDLMDKLLVAL